ncbi:MAG: hypothetical protein R3B13_21965 [Polyangiaceae bacterium]
MGRLGSRTLLLAAAALLFGVGSGVQFYRSGGVAELRATAQRARGFAAEEHDGKRSWSWPETFAAAHPEARRAVHSVCFEEGGFRPLVTGADGKQRHQSCLIDAANWMDDMATEREDRRLGAMALGLAALLAGLAALFIERRRRHVARALDDSG